MLKTKPAVFAAGKNYHIMVPVNCPTLMCEHVKPDMMLCGHLHKLAVNEVGCEKDMLGQPCTVVVGAEPEVYDPKISDKKSFKGAGISFSNGEIEVTFTNCSGECLETHKIK